MANDNVVRTLISKELKERFDYLDEKKEEDLERPNKYDSSYFMNLKNYFNEDNSDEFIELIDGRSLTRTEVRRTLKPLRDELHKKGYETSFIHFSPYEAKFTTGFYDEENLYQLRIRKKKSFFNRIFG
jgi:hypothetical protein